MLPKIRNSIMVCWCVLLVAGCIPDSVRRGNQALELGDYPLAVKLFTLVLEKKPADVEARLGIGKAYLQMAVAGNGDSLAWRTALMHLDAARTLAQSYQITQLVAQVWTERGDMLLAKGDTLRALSAISRAITIDDRSPQPLNIAGIIYYKTGKSVNARRLFERALTLDSTSIVSLFNLGMLFWEEGEVSKAHALWLRALKRAPGDEDLLYWFAAAEKNLRDLALSTEAVQ